MDKPIRWFSPTGKEIPKKELDKLFRVICEGLEPIKAPVEPPKDFREFEDRIGVFEEKLRMIFFGLTYEMDTGKTIKREKTTEAIVEALCNYDKYVKSFIINEQLNPYKLLKMAIEQDAPFVVCDDIYILGIKRDRTGLALPQKKQIAVQAAAQVLWYLERNKIQTLEEMKKRLLNKKDSMFYILNLNGLNHRTIENWVREVFPLPKNLRKGRPSKKGNSEDHFENLIRIPGIFLENEEAINFPKLRFVIICLTKVLTSLGWSVNKIKTSEIIDLYQNSLKFYPYIFVDDWIDETVVKNSSIFDS